MAIAQVSSLLLHNRRDCFLSFRVALEVVPKELGLIVQWLFL